MIKYECVTQVVCRLGDTSGMVLWIRRHGSSRCRYEMVLSVHRIVFQRGPVTIPSLILTQ